MFGRFSGVPRERREDTSASLRQAASVEASKSKSLKSLTTHVLCVGGTCVTYVSLQSAYVGPERPTPGALKRICQCGVQVIASVLFCKISMWDLRGHVAIKLGMWLRRWPGSTASWSLSGATLGLELRSQLPKKHWRPVLSPRGLLLSWQEQFRLGRPHLRQACDTQCSAAQTTLQNILLFRRAVFCLGKARRRSLQYLS
jgi:hypothetical protein